MACKKMYVNEMEVNSDDLRTNHTEVLSRMQTMKGFVHMEKEKFERLARQKQAQDQKLLKVMEMVAAPSPGNSARAPLAEKQAARDVSIMPCCTCAVWWLQVVVIGVTCASSALCSDVFGRCSHACHFRTSP